MILHKIYLIIIVVHHRIYLCAAIGIKVFKSWSYRLIMDFRHKIINFRHKGAKKDPDLDPEFFNLSQNKWFNKIKNSGYRPEKMGSWR